jgi:hypothetical protein
VEEEEEGAESVHFLFLFYLHNCTIPMYLCLYALVLVFNGVLIN